MIKCCIFDLDGTLLNTLGTIKFYMNKTLSSHGIMPISDDECRAFVGSGAKILMKRACLSRAVSDTALEEKMLSEYMADYDRDPYYLTEKYEGIDELAAELRANGIKLAVLSNKPDFATRSAVAHFFGSSFDTVLGGREGVPLKPDPHSAFEILEKFSLTPKECAYIGDSDVDVLTGKALGALLNISVLWGFRSQNELVSAGAKLLLSTPSEIKNIIIKR